MSRGLPSTGPDEDGFYWIKWVDGHGADRMIIGETLDQAEAKAKRTLGDDHGPGAPPVLH